MIEKLKTRWVTLVSNYSNNPPLFEKYWEEISGEYTANGRFYHNLEHLDHLLSLWDTFHPELEDPDTLQFSIFYHDMVYDVTRNDNEEKSVQRAIKRLKALAVPDEKIERCSRQIIATKSHHAREFKNDKDTAYFLDFDLAVLGSDWAAYEDYAGKIRAEYGIYPDDLYKRGRKKVLEHFLSVDRIYKTPHFFNTVEPQARKNIQRELKQL